MAERCYAATFNLSITFKPIKLIVVMLSFAMLSVVMLLVVAPLKVNNLVHSCINITTLEKCSPMGECSNDNH